MIDFKCPICGNDIHVDDSAAGRSGDCKKCGRRIEVPDLNFAEDKTVLWQPTRAMAGKNRKWAVWILMAAGILLMCLIMRIADSHRGDVVGAAVGISTVVLGIVLLAVGHSRGWWPPPDRPKDGETRKGTKLSQLHPCPVCQRKIAYSAKACPGCGRPISDADRMAWKPLSRRANLIIGVVGVGTVLICIWFCSGLGSKPGSTVSRPIGQPAEAKFPRIHGTLHQKSALDWQKADYDDKLATCTDFVAKMWQQESLMPRIQNSIKTTDDMKPYAEQLVASLDAAMRKDPDSVKNDQIYANQTVAGMAVMVMKLNGWLK
jgi:hypothetical protein